MCQKRPINSPIKEQKRPTSIDIEGGQHILPLFEGGEHILFLGQQDNLLEKAPPVTADGERKREKERE